MYQHMYGVKINIIKQFEKEEEMMMKAMMKRNRSRV